MIVVAYYTDDYTSDAEKLRESLDALGVKHEIRKLLDRGSWQRNAVQKSFFIHEMALKYNRQWVLYVNVDVVIDKLPVPTAPFSVGEEFVFFYSNARTQSITGYWRDAQQRNMLVPPNFLLEEFEQLYPILKLKNTQQFPEGLRFPTISRQKPYQEFDELIEFFNNKTCYIIGKGPSLDQLTPGELADNGPIIALNEAVHRIAAMPIDSRRIFGLQQDGELRDSCYPERGQLFINFRVAHFYNDKPNLITYRPAHYGLHDYSLSASMAIKLAVSYGCSKIIMCCFDACVNGTLGYATGIKDIRPDADPARFLKHRVILDDDIGSLPVQWLTFGRSSMVE